MKITRVAIAVTLGVSALAAGHASAAVKVKPVCNLVTDAPGDAFFFAGSGPTTDSLDVLSADVATNKHNITAVVRVKKLAATDPTFSPTGLQWNFTFTAEGQDFTFTALTDPTGKPTYEASYSDKTTGQGNLYAGDTVTGVFDVAKSQITMTAPIDVLAAQADFKVGSKLTGLDAAAGRIIAIPEATGKLGGGSLLTLNPASNDDATSTKEYVVGAPSCVIVPK